MCVYCVSRVYRNISRINVCNRIVSTTNERKQKKNRKRRRRKSIQSQTHCIHVSHVSSYFIIIFGVCVRETLLQKERFVKRFFLADLPPNLIFPFLCPRLAGIHIRHYILRCVVVVCTCIIDIRISMYLIAITHRGEKGS